MKIFSPSQLSTLPSSPGVYYFYDRSGKIIYVGKATSLKVRVSSYWQRPQNQQISRNLNEVVKIKVKVTSSTLEALILEANEIKRLQPKHNSLQKDDKSFASIVITKEEFPQVLVIRPTDKRKLPIFKTFGPYPSAFSARTALKILRRIFPFRCPNLVESGRACLYSHLNLCPGTCLGIVEPKKYQETIHRLIDFLSGKRTSVVHSIKSAMKKAARYELYEEAAKLRDQLFALEHIHDVALMTEDRESSIAQFPIKRIEAYDVSLSAERDAVASMVVLRYGIPTSSEYRQFRIKTVSGTNDVAMISEVLARRIKHPEWQLPDIFVIDGGLAQRNAAAKILKANNIIRPAVIGIAKGPTRKKIDLYFTPAAQEMIKYHGLSKDELTQILIRARDEAHRFAIKYHRKLRSKRIISG